MQINNHPFNYLFILSHCCTLLLLITFIFPTYSHANQAAANDDVNKRDAKKYVISPDKGNDMFDDLIKQFNETTGGFAALPKHEYAQYLVKLVKKKIDTNHDGFVSEDEWAKWLYTALIMSDKIQANDTINQNDKDLDGKLTFDEYMGEDDRTDKAAVEKERYKFKLADVNKDNLMDYKELPALMVPHRHIIMAPLTVNETLTTRDKNKNGFVDRDEYVPKEASVDDKYSMNKAFDKVDKNKDGKLDASEMVWLEGPNYEDIIEAETSMIFKKCDSNGDGKLSLNEIENAYDKWLKSSATNYGDYMKKIKHDEL